MSQKKNPKRNPQGKTADKNIKSANAPKKPEAKNSKKLILIAAAVIVVVAAVLVGVFVIKPAIEEKGKEPTTVPVVTNAPNEGEKYSYVDYKGTKMPVQFVELLNQAEIDGQNAASKYGVALTVGKRDISRSEFCFYYIDQYYLQLQEIEYSIEQRGSNMTGYDANILPDEQMVIGTDYTFAEDFTRKAIDSIQTIYASFDLAVESGTELDEYEIDSLISSYERVFEYIEMSREEITADEAMKNVYGDGVTYAMFAAREIMMNYIKKHEEVKADEYFKACTENEIKERLDSNETKYKVVKARVYPIEGEYDAEEISLVSNEEKFLEFAQNNYPNGNYSAKHKTNCHFVTYDTIGRTFGYDVADWAFSESRVPGEVGLVQGQLYECLVYIETPAFFDTSCDVLTYEYKYPEGMTEEEFNVIANDIQTLYDGWVEKGMSEEEARQTFRDTGYGFERTYRTGDLFFVVNSWILDEKRKSGDMGMFNDGETVYIVYYCSNNEDDFDWDFAIRNEMSLERYQSEYDLHVEKKCQVSRKENVIKQAWKSANVKITQKINASAN